MILLGQLVWDTVKLGKFQLSKAGLELVDVAASFCTDRINLASPFLPRGPVLLRKMAISPVDLVTG